MCGIVGKSNGIVDQNFLAAMETLSARGPDSSGIWNNEHICLGHTRLAIRDLTERANQPLLTPDGRYVILFNGEIYNHEELKTILTIKNNQLSIGTSDTEIICNLYQYYEDKLFEMLDGMFAIAVYDRSKNTLTLSRDLYGIKPLYYTCDSGVYFASQVKVLRALTGGISKVSPKALSEFEYFGHVLGGHTFYENIFECQPGEILKFDLASNAYESTFYDKIENYWNDTANLESCQFSDKIESAIIDSVKRHCVSDAKICVYLSGGLDSAAIAAAVSISKLNVECITVGFERFKGTSLDEVPGAREIAERYKLKHYAVYYDDNELTTFFNDFVSDMDQPSIDGFNIWLASKFAKTLKFKVALTGCGADELFFGYKHLRLIPLLYKFRGFLKIFNQIAITRILRKAKIRKINKLLNLIECLDSLPCMLDAFRSVSATAPMTDNREKEDRKLNIPTLEDNPIRFCSFFESTNYLRHRLLRDADWASSQHGIEIRLPFVDRGLLRSLAPYMSYYEKYSKKRLFRFFRRLNLPRRILNSAKVSFNVPSIRGNDAAMNSRGLSTIEYQKLVLHSYNNSTT